MICCQSVYTFQSSTGRTHKELQEHDVPVSIYACKWLQVGFKFPYSKILTGHTSGAITGAIILIASKGDLSNQPPTQEFPILGQGSSAAC